MIEGGVKKLAEEDDEADAANIGTLCCWSQRCILYEGFEFQENNAWNRNGFFKDKTMYL